MQKMTRSTGALIALMASTAIASPAHAQIASAPPPKFSNVDENGVDLTTGLVSFSLAEGSIGSGAGAISFQRIWAQDAGWVDNWTGGFYSATINGQTVTVVQIAGISETFTESGGIYTNQKADGGTLAISGGVATYTASDGTKIEYAASGYDIPGSHCPGAVADTCYLPSQIILPNGLKYSFGFDQVTLCRTYYPGEGCVNERTYSRISAIFSSAGYSAAFKYQTNDAGSGSIPAAGWTTQTGVSFNNSVTPITPAPASSYSYPSSGVMDVTDMGGRTWRLTTNASGRLSGIRRPGSATDNVTYTYGTGGNVISATRDGVTTNYSLSVSGSTGTMTVTNALSQQTVVTSDLTLGRVTSVTDALSRTTSFQYDANSRLTRTTAPEGNYTQLTLDARGNVRETRDVAKSGSGLPDIVTSADYDTACSNPVTCNKPNSITDARGNVTDYTYDSTHGGVTSVTYPAPTTGGVRPKVSVTYSAITPSYAGGTPVTLPTTISACQTTASCDGTADEVEVVTAYNGMLQAATKTSRDGALTVTATEAYAYDQSGNPVTVDGPLSGTADTSKYRYNAARDVVGAISADPDGAGTLKHRAVKYSYDAAGILWLTQYGTVTDQSDTAWANFSESYRHFRQIDANGRINRETI